MAKRLRIGLIYTYREDWIAVSYYFLSIIKSLNYLPDRKKPSLVVVVSNSKEGDEVKSSNYPYLEVINYNQLRFLSNIENGLKIFLNKNYDLVDRYISYKVDCCYLYRHTFPFFKHVKNKIFWVADFQEFKLRKFFTEESFQSRSAIPRYVSKTYHTLALSSYDAKRDFKKYFPDHTCKIKVVQFATNHPPLPNNANKILEKYKINKKYFICSNQFWQHKNHEIILSAVRNLSKDIDEYEVLFTGKNYDFRTTSYYPKLIEYVEKNNLQKNVKFLGFIPRIDQLVLMNNSIAVIQPSFFEGWSTTVEDVKSLNHFIILSNISVHKEQIKENVIFFDPNNSKELAQIMKDLLYHSPKIKYVDYNMNIKKFASDFIDACSN